MRKLEGFETGKFLTVVAVTVALVYWVLVLGLLTGAAFLVWRYV